MPTVEGLINYFCQHPEHANISFSFDMFLKISDSCGFFPQLKKRSWRNCHIWNWAQFCKEIAHVFLKYGMEAVLSAKVEIPSLRILSETQLTEAEWARARYEQLNFINEKRMTALCHGQLYQRRIERSYMK